MQRLLLGICLFSASAFAADHFKDLIDLYQTKSVPPVASDLTELATSYVAKCWYETGTSTNVDPVQVMARKHDDGPLFAGENDLVMSINDFPKERETWPLVFDKDAYVFQYFVRPVDSKFDDVYQYRVRRYAPYYIVLDVRVGTSQEFSALVSEPEEVRRACYLWKAKP